MTRFRVLPPPLLVLPCILLSGQMAHGQPAAPQATDLLDLFRQYGECTDPGEYRSLYAGLPTGLEALCARIKQQLVHPVDIGRFPELAGTGSEDERFYAVQDMLAELLKRNPGGLVPDRRPAQRLRLSCRFHALLLASILKSQGVPARLRVGFAAYLSPPGLHLACDHWLCEVWDRGRGRWILVDPDRGRVDVPPGQFEAAGEVWLAVQQGKADPSRYGVWKWWGRDYVKANLLHDLSCVTGRELIYWEGPALARKPAAACSPEELRFLAEAARLLQDVDANWTALRRLGSDPLLGEVRDYARYADASGPLPQ